MPMSGGISGAWWKYHQRLFYVKNSLPEHQGLGEYHKLLLLQCLSHPTELLLKKPVAKAQRSSLLAT